MDRFERTRMLFGEAGLARLQASRVAVAGLGAVGSYAVEGLARAGVGHLRLVDFDCVQRSNINRQLYALDSTLGLAKVEVAAARVRDINPDCEIEAVRTFVDRETAPGVCRRPLDAVVDAIDSVGPKVELIHAAVLAGVPVVSSMGAGSRTDPLALRVGDLADTESCPLARHVRKRLRRRGVASGVRCVYSVEQVPGPASPDAAAAAGAEEEAIVRGRRRRPIPSFSCLTGMFGLIAAREVVLRIVAGDWPAVSRAGQ